ncbi:selenocysteine-specific translation elongation factor [Roseateles amylovorans]|uniref:Selenocysteine-specific elongation factor n=1 Tax=Roseateles amylovorans TaxID=2978473 RepID=A0ABY6B3E5_9BURK|nr:selenocysteine-specific translation elongation factor [Roseateles amylovorans]UXH79906.1 selenocysteine-specific translation elongation factor [Roseateles amylovorans]
MIIGTAGHIDHGKTTLVKALTGVDTDRLPEEKRRGISIALGYAYLDAGEGQRLGFVDVPGHERLVHTMLSGATGIDHALLLVAADDGVMPQTREHLALLSLLGIERGTVALTKCDRADAALRAARRAEIDELLAHTSLAGAPIFEVAATTGEGVVALRQHLLAQSRQMPARDVAGQGFRLAIDRVFSLSGVGTVCTGTAYAGEVRIGDELWLLPPAAGQVPQVARVRSLHAQNESVEHAQVGQRVAIGLAGLDKDEVARGQWLAAPEVAQWSDRIDVRLRLWSDEAKPLRSGTPVHVHLGAAEATGSVAILGGLDGQVLELVQPGAEALVQIVLHQPMCGWAGDRVVLRDASATRALAGGRVLDPQAPARYRRTPQRLAELIALSQPDPIERLRGLLAQAPAGVDLSRLAAAQGLARDARAPWWSAAVAPGPKEAKVAEAASDADAGDGLVGGSAEALSTGRIEGTADAAMASAWALGPMQAGVWEALALERLAQYHRDQPDELGPDLARWRRLSAPRLAEPLWRALVQRMAERGQVRLAGAAVHLPAHGVALSALDERLAQKVLPRLVESGFEGSWVRDLAGLAQESEALMRTTLARLAQRGELFQVVKDLYYAPAAIHALAQLARGAAQEDGDVRAALFRDRSGLGRKRAIQVLEFFDRVGLLRRVGDAHKLRADCQLFLDEGEPVKAA